MLEKLKSRRVGTAQIEKAAREVNGQKVGRDETEVVRIIRKRIIDAEREMFKLHVEWQKKEKSMRVLITDQDIRDKYYKEQKYVGEMLWKKGKKKYDSKVRMAVKKVRKEKDIAEMR